MQNSLILKKYFDDAYFYDGLLRDILRDIYSAEIFVNGKNMRDVSLLVVSGKTIPSGIYSKKYSIIGALGFFPLFLKLI